MPKHHIPDFTALIEHHAQMSTAYQIGADAVEITANATVMRCIRRVQSMASEPGTCGHPGKVLSKATIRRNQIIEEIARQIAEELPCNIRVREIRSEEREAKRLARRNKRAGIPDDDIPF